MANLRRINQEDLRNHNLSVTLDTLLRAQKPMSRADLAKETGLTKATLSLLASMLIESGVVQEGEPVVSTTYGRPSTPLEIRGGSIAGIGLQINTDGYGCLALDLNGDTLGREWVSEDMTGTDPYEIFAKLDAMAFPLESRLKRRGCKVVGAGLALPGIVTDDMWLLVARNLGWENVNLTRFNVVRRLDVVAGNEAKMAAIAQIPGYATERASFLNVVDRTDSFIYLSTDIGIGGAVVRDGEVVMGSHGFAGEIGHLSVAMDGPLCSCGRHGCLEAFAGRRALVEAAGIAEDGDATSSEAIDMFLQRWRAGDSDVAKVVDQAADALVSAIASAVNLVDVDTVLLGGLWTHFGDELATVLEGRLRSEILGYPNVKIRVFVPPVALHPSLYGAAEMGLRRFIENPLGYMGEK
ncbi:ROK family transcriptional regulator [Bifidobacterium longum]|uniref:ROK family transcriptional regulator n=1 Tax=Bifidobacterium longum TaxID=216816 RepID=UPI0018A0B250|nr:ROK family transcriptional regulator [Bifidobacterium longum]MDB6599126.1 ROK family transcriptional regulator [Bifidobacterium longum]MDB6601181.1 ROK family transcriptional regulator [Bifidobacterium longum]MDB6795732.1 ROK family transcriptional regulator [Bifidobacterium longum]MDB6797729.1 ROK family transcriptional regulator [Bifidobacterium longum]MDB6799685.1 ROK family transcriptional regulator [Bifidobacterium longum]